jgi:hypothetical protein
MYFLFCLPSTWAYDTDKGRIDILRIQKEALAKFKGLVRNSKTVGDFIEGLKNHSVDPEFDVLEKHFKPFRKEPAMKFVRDLKNGLVIGVKSSILPIEYVPGELGVFLINQKRVDLSAKKSLEQKWQIIEAVVPKIGQFRTMDLFHSEARAWVAAVKFGAAALVTAGSVGYNLIQEAEVICKKFQMAADLCSEAYIDLSRYLHEKFDTESLRTNAPEKKSKPHCQNPSGAKISSFDKEFEKVAAPAAAADLVFEESMTLPKRVTGYAYCAGRAYETLQNCNDRIEAKKECFGIDSLFWRGLGARNRQLVPNFLLDKPTALEPQSPTGPGNQKVNQ